MPVARLDGAGTRLDTCCSAICTGVSPPKGLVPVSISNSTTPGGVDVAAGVGRTSLDLLGGEVGHRADEQPGLAVRRGGTHGSGQAEVGDLHPSVVGDQHVLGLDVAVHDAGAVRGAEGVEHGLEQVEGLVGGHRAAVAHHVAQRASGHVLHGEEHHAVVTALVEDLHDPRVVEPGGRAGLAGEPADERLVVDEVGVHDLERHLAVEPLVEREVHRGHAAARDARAHHVAPVELTAHERVGHRHVHGPESTVGQPRTTRTASSGPGRCARTAGCRRACRGCAPRRAPGSSPRSRGRAVRPTW